MRRTRAGTIALLAVIGGVLAWSIDVWLQTSARPILVPGITLAPTLLVISAVLVAVAWPVRRYTKGLRDRQQGAAGGGAGPLDDDDEAAEGSGRTSPIRRGASEPPRDASPGLPRPDPFVALRVLAFAKASAFAGAILLGGCLAILAFVMTRSFVVAEHLALAGAGAAGSAVLLAVGLIVESWCSLPPDGSAPLGRRAAALD